MPTRPGPFDPPIAADGHDTPPRQPRLVEVADGSSADQPTARGAPHSDTVAAHLAKADRRPATTIWRANPREQGLIGLTDAIAWFGARGWSIALPLIDSQPYDLVVDDGDSLHRVQVKTTTARSPYGVYVVKLETRGGNQSYHSAKPFEPAHSDPLYVLTDAGDRYLVPTATICARRQLNLGRQVEPYRVPAP